MKVYKYAIPRTADSWVEMPEGAKILCVDEQDDLIVIWALVDPKAQKEKRHFSIVGTGWDTRDGLVYIGTVFSRNPATGFPNGFVWHVFEVE